MIHYEKFIHHHFISVFYFPLPGSTGTISKSFSHLLGLLKSISYVKVIKCGVYFGI
jgi:hypothetical protein